MNTPLPPDHDEALPGEAELAALYRKLPKSEPGPALDAAIRRAAAEALGPREAVAAAPIGSTTRARRQVTPAKARPRWPVALGMAATLVLVGGLAWHMRGMPDAGTAGYQAAAPAASTMARANSPAARDMATAGVPVTAGGLVPATRQPMPSLPARPAEPMADRIAPPTAMKSMKLAPERDRSVRVGASVDLAKAAPAILSSAPTVALSENAVVATPAAAPAAPAAVAEIADAARSSESAPAASEAESAGNVASTAAAPSAFINSQSTDKKAADTPAQELEKIRQLFAAQRDDEARQRLDAFRHAHPAWILPPDLRDRLRQP